MKKVQKKHLKKLIKAYNKKLKLIHKNNFHNQNNNLDYFITYLQYIRDYLIFNNFEKQGEKENLSILALVTALDEYENYNLCIQNYFTIIGNTIKAITTGTLKENSLEEATEQYNKEKQAHWHKFWKLVELNIEEWFENYANI